MDIASLVLGIIAIVLCFVPCGAWLAVVVGVVGLALGIVAVIQKSKAQQAKGNAIAGVVLNAIAIFLVVFAYQSFMSEFSLVLSLC